MTQGGLQTHSAEAGFDLPALEVRVNIPLSHCAALIRGGISEAIIRGHSLIRSAASVDVHTSDMFFSV